MALSARLAAFYCAYFFQVGLFTAYFPLYLADRGFRAFEIAWVLAMPQLMRTFAPAAWGWLADRSGALPAIVAFSCAAAAAGFAALPFVEGLPAVVCVIAAASLLSAGGLPIVEAITVGRLPALYGPIRLWGSVGFVVAVLAGGWWLELVPMRMLPWALAAVLLFSLGVAASLPRAGIEARAEPAPWRLSSPIVALLGAGFCMAAAHGTLYAFFSVHLERLGYRVATIGVLWTVGVLAEIVVFLYLPKLFRRFSLGTILRACFICAVVRFLALGWLAEALWILVLVQLLHAATFGAFHAAAVAAVRRLFPADGQARGQSLFSSFTYGAGGAVGALVAGWLWEAAGPGVAFAFSALAGLAGLHLAQALKRGGL